MHFSEKDKTNKEAIGKPFPGFSFLTDRKTIDNNSLLGKTVFINFWFEACAPCIAEFDALNEMYQKFKDNKKFEFVSFTFETPEKIKEIKTKYRLPYTIISIEREECYRLNLNNGFPTSMVLDSTGAIKYMVHGGFTDKAKAREFVHAEIYPEIIKQL